MLGCGAEIFTERVRSCIRPNKISAKNGPSIHGMGLAICQLNSFLNKEASRSTDA
jgi:hypothetical protein